MITIASCLDSYGRDTVTPLPVASLVNVSTCQLANSLIRLKVRPETGKNPVGMINNPSQLSGLRSPLEILHLPTANRLNLTWVVLSGLLDRSVGGRGVATPLPSATIRRPVGMR